MKNKNRLLFAPCLIATLIIPAWSHAFQRPVLPSGRAPLALEWAAERLELADDQRSQIRDILAAYRNDLLMEIAAVKSARETLFETIHEHPPSEARVRQASAGVALAETDLAITRSQIADQVYAVLTPEQQEEMTDIRQDLATFVQVIVDRLQGAFLGLFEG